MKPELQQHFENIRQLIRNGQTRAIQAVYAELLQVYWQVGAYLHDRLKEADYGAKVVDEFVNWMKEHEPGMKGFDKRSIYRMQEFYIAWHAVDWKALIGKNMPIVGAPPPQLQTIENQESKIAVAPPPQFNSMPAILSKLSWSHHLELLGKTKSAEEKLFYLLLSIKDNYSYRDLRRQIASGLYERQKLSSRDLSKTEHPAAQLIPQIFKDQYIFEFLDLPEPHTESDLQKGLIKRLKHFILELGRDFLFVGEEYRLQVGMNDYRADLLFFHRELQCLVVFELKTEAFKPEYLGKINFYLEALDRDVKKPHENPSIGVLLCKTKDKEVVEYAMSRNMSPALVAEYKTKLIDKALLQRMLHEWAEKISEKG
jgi:predicted nuclease of restriction endonuclease-like (RecB) superfamily